MPDGTDEFEKVILSAGENDFSFIGEAYNTEFYTNPFIWGAAGGEPVLLPHQRIFEGTIRNVQSGILFMEAGATGTIKSVYLHRPGFMFFGSWYFNIRINGVPQWAGTNRLLLQGPTEKVVNIPVARGDSLILDLEQKGPGSVSGPFVWIVTIETQ